MRSSFNIKGLVFGLFSVGLAWCDLALQKEHICLAEKGAQPCASKVKVGLASTRCPCPKPSGFVDFCRFPINPRPRSTRALAMAWRSRRSPAVPRCFATASSLTPTAPSKPGQRIPNIVQGNALEVQCPVECFGLLYLNPPYDWALGPAESRRTEPAFLSHTYRWLKPGGVLIFVIPGDRLVECSQILSTHLRDVRVFRLEAPECVRYKQVVVIGARRSRREKERLTDNDITRARLYYASLARNQSQIPVLPSEPELRYAVPESGPAQLVHRGLPLDEIEDLLPQSSAYRQAGRILFAEPVSAAGRPLTPLHAGHVGLLACSGLLNGIFGSGDQRHISCWQAVKVTDKTEEEEDGVITIREKERFSNELTLVYSTGEVATLK